MNLSDTGPGSRRAAIAAANNEVAHPASDWFATHTQVETGVYHRTPGE